MRSSGRRRPSPRTALGALAAVTLLGMTGPAAATAAEPTIALAPYTPIAATAVRLTGYVNPNGESTSYFFEYGEGECSGGCASAPAAKNGLAGETEPVQVTVEVTGLEPATTYHFRLVAQNASGTMASEDATFATLERAPEDHGSCPNEAIRRRQGTTGLPECRAYELVTPVAANLRNNMNVAVQTERTRAAADGGAINFASATAVEGSESVPGAAEYLSVRGSGGWALHEILPAQHPLSFAELLFGGPGYVGELSSDLSSGVVLSNAALDDSDNTSGPTNLYLGENLLSSNGTYRLLTERAIPKPGNGFRAPAMADATADFSHVLFESYRPLVPEAEGIANKEEWPQLYEWVAGAGVHMVGFLPASEGGGPTTARAGRGAGNFYYTPHTLSSDGSRAIFLVPQNLVGARGQLYMRDDHGTVVAADDTTVKLNASEKTNGAGPGGTDPAGPQPAEFWDATPDLSQVFFTSKEALTNDAPADEPEVDKLYRYSLDAPAGEHLTLLSVDHEPADGVSDAARGVIGSSADGRFVYFIGPNQLQAGGPTQPAERIFVWHDGEIREVGAINAGLEEQRLLGSNPWHKLPGADTRWTRLSPDGRHLLFVSEGSAELVGYDQGDSCPGIGGELGVGGDSCTGIYSYEADGFGPGRLQCASCNPSGIAAKADADFFENQAGPLVSPGSYLNRPMSADGRLVSFTSGDRLVPADRNDRSDAYVFDTATGEVRLLSSGEGPDDAFFLDGSGDGGDLFFATRARLLAEDSNAEDTDIYDARVDGGFDESAPGFSPCGSIDQCRPATVASAVEPAASEAQQAPSAKRPRRCSRGRRRDGLPAGDRRRCSAGARGGHGKGGRR